MSEDYARFMGEAIRLAELGRYDTAPNPTVGAVLVQDGAIVARGWHRAAGQAHAEVDCLRNARSKGIDVANSTLVVTLEPCNHYGKTPPCTKAIIESGISRVVMGLSDSNPVAAGGAQALREAGIEVVGPVCEAACRDLVRDFMVWQQEQRPFVTLKLACSIDGHIATANGHSKWISSAASRERVHAMRAGMGRSGGAVLVGGNTFRHDDPLLSARPEGKECDKQPWAAVVTSHLPDDPSQWQLTAKRPQSTIFFAPEQTAHSPQAETLRALGARVHGLPADADGKTGLRQMLALLWQEHACHHVLCEGGASLATSLLEAGLADEVLLHMAPMVLGDAAARPLFCGRSPQSMAEALRLEFVECLPCGGDMHMRLRPQQRK